MAFSTTMHTSFKTYVYIAHWRNLQRSSSCYSILHFCSHIIFIFIYRRQKKQTRFLWSPRPKWRIVLCFEYLESGWKYSHVTYLEPIPYFWNCGHFDVSLECWRLCGNPPSVWHFKGTPIWKQGKRFFLQKRHLGWDMIYYEIFYPFYLEWYQKCLLIA